MFFCSRYNVFQLVCNVYWIGTLWSMKHVYALNWRRASPGNKLICITNWYVLRPGNKLKPSLDRFDLTCLTGKERHSNDKTKLCLGHNSYYYLGRNSLIFKTCQYSYLTICVTGRTNIALFRSKLFDLQNMLIPLIDNVQHSRKQVYRYLGRNSLIFKTKHANTLN